MQTDSAYRASWRRYTWWYVASLGLFVGYLPTFALAGRVFPDAFHQTSVVLPAFFIYGGVWMAVSNVARRWKCPRCGKYFFGDLVTPKMPMLFVRSCRSCGLPKYARADPALT